MLAPRGRSRFPEAAMPRLLPGLLLPALLVDSDHSGDLHRITVQQVYMAGHIAFIKDVDAGRF